MKLGELFIKLTTKGNTKELEKALKQLKEADKETSRQLKLKKDLAKATTDEEKQLIKKNYEQKREIDATQKLINKQKERNQAIISSIKGFAGFVSAVSLAVGVLDRFVNANAKANQSVLTISKSTGISADTINKYASASMDKNINVTRESVAQTFDRLATSLRMQQMGQDTSLLQGMQILASRGGKPFTSYGLNAEQFFEQLREGIKGVSDEWASHALTTMGISPDLLPMLRMSKEEFDKTKNRFLSEKEMTEEQKMVQELSEMKGQINKTIQLLELRLIPIIANIYKVIEKITAKIPKFLQGKDLPENTPKDVKDTIVKSRQTATALTAGAIATKQYQIAGLIALAEKIGEDIFKEWKSTGVMQLSPYGVPAYNTGTTNNTFNTTINTTQPADKVMADKYQEDIKLAQKNQQKVGK